MVGFKKNEKKQKNYLPSDNIPFTLSETPVKSFLVEFGVLFDTL